MSVFTKRAIDIFNPVDGSGNARGASIGDVQRWGTEVETKLFDFEGRLANIPENPIVDWIDLHSA